MFDAVVSGVTFFLSFCDLSYFAYRDATESWMVILYTATLLDLFFRFNHALVEFLWVFMYEIVLSAYSFISFFPAWIPLSLFLVWLPCLRRLAWVAQEWGEWASLCCRWSQKRNSQLFSVESDVNCGLPHGTFILLSCVHSIPNLKTVFIMKCLFWMNGAFSLMPSLHLCKQPYVLYHLLYFCGENLYWFSHVKIFLTITRTLC